VRDYNYIILLILFIIYIFYLFLEEPLIDEDDPYNFSEYQLLQLDNHKQAMANISQIEATLTGIILGGSNALSGLSARHLSDHSNGELFYNYSLSGSMNKITIYLDSLREISLIDKEAVKVVIFSDLMFFVPKNTVNNSGSGKGKFSLKVFPSTPLLKHISYKYLPLNPLFPRDMEYGDLDWSGSYSDICRPHENFIMIPNNLENIKQRHLKIRKEIQEIFLNSKIFFMVPNISNDSSSLLLKYFDDIKILYKESNLNLILKPPRTEDDIFCYSGFYLNQKGRTLITNEIIEIIRTY
jgi:hypothetical protein